MGNLSGARSRPARAGFTLVELLLTVALFLLLASVAVFNFGSLQRGAPLEEGGALLETLFRYTRAQSASTGRTLRIVFSEEPGTVGLSLATNAAPGSAGGIRVLWEADPVGAPGQFAVVAEAGAFTERLNELVEIRAVRAVSGWESGSAKAASRGVASTDMSTNSASTSAPGWPGSESPWLPVVFYPDGSSDSVEVWMSSRDAEDLRQLGVTLSGVVGTTRRKWRSADPSSVPGEASESPELEDVEEPSRQ